MKRIMVKNGLFIKLYVVEDTVKRYYVGKNQKMINVLNK